MDIYQLSYFKKVYDSGGLTRAAEELLLTQPAVSKQIKALEEELGEKLFDRIGKKVFPTDAGRLLYGHAEKILASVEEAESAVRGMSKDCSGRLVIGASDHVSLHRLPDVLKNYISSFPKVDLKLRCHRSETVLELVEKNLVDIGVITLPADSRSLSSLTIWKDPMSLVYPPGHPLTGLESIKLRDVARYGMILPEQGTTTRKEIDSAFQKKKLTPDIRMQVAYIETIKMLVKVGLGISILPDKAVEIECASGALLKSPIQDARFSRNLGVVHLRDKFLSRPAQAFLGLILEQKEKKGL